MTTAIFIIFCIVYLGMILGGLPFLQLDRTGIALLGAIALIGVEAVSPEEAAKLIHLPTLILLFSFMVVSAQMRLGGFYTWVTRALAALPLSPPLLLAALIVAAAALSAVFSNDVVCLAVAPVLIEACLARRDRKSTRLNSSHPSISYAVFCLKKKRESTNRHEGYKKEGDERTD